MILLVHLMVVKILRSYISHFAYIYFDILWVITLFSYQLIAPETLLVTLLR
jgi:hypothetical protein